jgi:hypothetical protein
MLITPIILQVEQKQKNSPFLDYFVREGQLLVGNIFERSIEGILAYWDSIGVKVERMKVLMKGC